MQRITLLLLMVPAITLIGGYLARLLTLTAHAIGLTHSIIIAVLTRAIEVAVVLMLVHLTVTGSVSERKRDGAVALTGLLLTAAGIAIILNRITWAPPASPMVMISLGLFGLGIGLWARWLSRRSRSSSAS